MVKQFGRRFRNVFLTGLPGVGKSTFGKVYALQSGRTFVDFDRYLESEVGRTIVDIFENDGETKFRTIESKMLHSLDRRQNCVVALGGATLCNEEALKFVRSLGAIVWLDANIEELTERNWEERETRPLFKVCKSKDEVSRKIAELTSLRTPFYSAADVTLRTNYSSMDSLKFELWQYESLFYKPLWQTEMCEDFGQLPLREIPYVEGRFFKPVPGGRQLRNPDDYSNTNQQRQTRNPREQRPQNSQSESPKFRPHSKDDRHPIKSEKRFSKPESDSNFLEMNQVEAESAPKGIIIPGMSSPKGIIIPGMTEHQGIVIPGMSEQQGIIIPSRPIAREIVSNQVQAQVYQSQKINSAWSEHDDQEASQENRSFQQNRAPYQVDSRPNNHNEEVEFTGPSRITTREGAEMLENVPHREGRPETDQTPESRLRPMSRDQRDRFEINAEKEPKTGIILPSKDGEIPAARVAPVRETPAVNMSSFNSSQIGTSPSNYLSTQRPMRPAPKIELRGEEEVRTGIVLPNRPAVKPPSGESQ